MQPEPIRRWHGIIAHNNTDDLDALLAEDVVFHSPAVHKPQPGRVMTAKYLCAAMAVLNNPSFHYAHQWIGERSAVLEFDLTLDGVELNGVDIIHWNDAGLITMFKVMVRPIKGLNTLITHMARQLSPPG